MDLRLHLVFDTRLSLIVTVRSGPIQRENFALLQR